MGVRAEQRGWALGLGIILGGALGNLTDRAFRAGDGFLGGRVVDMVDLQWWPVFNLADAALWVGVGVLLLASRQPDGGGRGVIVREVVPEALAGERVDRVVAMVTGLSRNEVAELVDAGAVRVGGEVVTTRSTRVRAGDEIEVDVPERDAEAALEAEPDVVVPVVHEDEHLLVVDKPAGLVVHPGAGQRTGTLVQGLLARYPELARRRRRPRAARHRAPARQGHVRAAARGPHRARRTPRSSRRWPRARCTGGTARWCGATSTRRAA